MLWPFIFCFLGFALLVGAIICIRFRSEILNRNSIRPWVRTLVSEQVTLPEASLSPKNTAESK
jgi:heme exporter protein C